MSDADTEDYGNNENASRGKQISMLKINIDGLRSHKRPQVEQEILEAAGKKRVFIWNWVIGLEIWKYMIKVLLHANIEMDEIRLEYKYADKVELQDLQMEQAFSRLLYFSGVLKIK